MRQGYCSLLKDVFNDLIDDRGLADQLLLRNFIAKYRQVRAWHVLGLHCNSDQCRNLGCLNLTIASHGALVQLPKG